MAGRVREVWEEGEGVECEEVMMWGEVAER